MESESGQILRQFVDEWLRYEDGNGWALSVTWDGDGWQLAAEHPNEGRRVRVHTSIGAGEWPDDEILGARVAAMYPS